MSDGCTWIDALPRWPFFVAAVVVQLAVPALVRRLTRIDAAGLLLPWARGGQS